MATRRRNVVQLEEATKNQPMDGEDALPVLPGAQEQPPVDLVPPVNPVPPAPPVDQAGTNRTLLHTLLDFCALLGMVLQCQAPKTPPAHGVAVPPHPPQVSPVVEASLEGWVPLGNSASNERHGYNTFFGKGAKPVEADSWLKFL